MSGGALRQEILTLEKRLLDPAIRSDRRAVEALLDPDFTEIGQSGRLWDRAAILAALAAEPSTGTPLRVSGFEVRELAPDVVLATYMLEQTATRRSSIWRRGEGGGEGGWRMVFHQGTRMAG